MSIIINPAQERLAKEAKDGLILDEKNLARTVFTNSYFSAKNPSQALSAEEAFDAAASFVREQTRRFPLNNTVDGRSKE